MAINPETQYPGKIAPSTPKYPYGAARNVTLPGDGTGTPWDSALVNDLFGWQQAILAAAGLVPTGTPEEVGASQYLDGLLRIGEGRSAPSFRSVADLQANALNVVFTEGMIVTTGATHWKVVSTNGLALPGGLKAIPANGLHLSDFGLSVDNTGR